MGNEINLSFPLTQDVKIYMPTNQYITGCVSIQGGRNVRVIGGEWNLLKGDACLYIDSPAKSIFVEGCHLNSGTNYQSAGGYIDHPDIIAFRNNNVYSYDIYFQNVLIDYCLYGGTDNSNHTDCTQEQFNHPNLTGNIYYENCSFTTSDQAIFLQASQVNGDGSITYWPVANTVNFHNVDLQYGAAPVAGGGLLWLADIQAALPVSGGTINGLYVTSKTELPYSGWPWYEVALWPKDAGWVYDDGSMPCKGWGTIVSSDGESVTCAPADKMAGSIYYGRPAGGSFVQAVNVGRNYKSPWP